MPATLLPGATTTTRGIARSKVSSAPSTNTVNSPPTRKPKKRYWTRIKIAWIFWFTWAGSIVSISNSPTFCRIKRQKKPTIMVGFLMEEDYSSTWYSNAGMTISTRRFCSRPAAVAFDAIGLLSPSPLAEIRAASTPFSCSASDTA